MIYIKVFKEIIQVVEIELKLSLLVQASTPLSPFIAQVFFTCATE